MNIAGLPEAIRAADMSAVRYSEEEIFEHFSEKYESVPYEGRDVFILSNAREFGDSKHIVSLHASSYPLVPEHIYQYVLITYCYSGQFRMAVGNEPVRLYAGDCIVADRHVPHGVLPTDEETMAVNIVLSERFFKRRMRSDINRLHSSFATALGNPGFSHTGYRVYRTSDDELVRMCMNRILCERLDPANGSDDIIDDFVAALLTHLLRTYEADAGKVDERSRKNAALIGEIRAYVEKNYRTGSLTKMAEDMGYEPSYLSATIRQCTAMTYKQMVNEERMRHALVLLQTTDMPAYQIASEVGISNLTQFYKRFREYTGRTPQEYRDSW